MAWACVSGARWAAPGRARTTVRFSPLTSRGPMSSASIKAVARRGGRAVGLLALLLSVSPPVRLSAQGLLSQFSYDNLKPSALQLDRSEEHTSELQSRRDLVCRLLLEKKK